MLLDRQLVDECSLLSPESAGVRYSHSEVRALLDLTAQWLEDRPGEREVVILTGRHPSSPVSHPSSPSQLVEYLCGVVWCGTGSACGSFVSSIEIAPIAPIRDGLGASASVSVSAASSSLKQGSSAPASSWAPSYSRMVQVCCGPVVGGPAAEGEGAGAAALQLPLNAVKIHSPTREFRVQHRPASASTPGQGQGQEDGATLFSGGPLCTVIDVPVGRCSHCARRLPTPRSLSRFYRTNAGPGRRRRRRRRRSAPLFDGAA